MSHLQYIGARYVPIFYDNSVDHSTEWEPNVRYDPMVWVTLSNGHMYLSKKTVPDTVGSPAMNMDYWLDVGSYDGYITLLQNQIDTITALLGSEPLQTQATTITGAINEILAKIPFVTPEMFGAVGDGVTNDYDAICAAIDFAVANSHMVASQFSEGALPVLFTKDYLFDGTPYSLSGKYGVNLQSCKQGAVIRCPQGFAAFDNAGVSSQGVRGLNVTGLTFICNEPVIIFKIHKPRNSVFRDCTFRSDENVNQAKAIQTCATVDLQFHSCTFYELDTGIEFINDSYMGQATTTLVDACRFSTCTYGINAYYLGTNSFIKNLDVIDSIFELGTAGIRLISGNYVSHVNVTGCHFEMYIQGAVVASRGTILFDSSNFVFVDGNTSKGLIVYSANDIDNSIGNTMTEITLPNDSYINSILDMLISSVYHMIVTTPTWAVNTLEKWYERTVNSIDVDALMSIYACTIDFRSTGGCWFGYAWKENGNWYWHQDGGNITGMVTNTNGTITAPLTGRFKIYYS